MSTVSKRGEWLSSCVSEENGEKIILLKKKETFHVIIFEKHLSVTLAQYGDIEYLHLHKDLHKDSKAHVV